jgi:hypothetical protein
LQFSHSFPTKNVCFSPWKNHQPEPSAGQETLLAAPGSFGTVLGEYSDTRLIVCFDQRQDGREEAPSAQREGRSMAKHRHDGWVDVG